MRGAERICRLCKRQGYSDYILRPFGEICEGVYECICSNSHACRKRRLRIIKPS